jgi:hypothetical protein
MDALDQLLADPSVAADADAPGFDVVNVAAAMGGSAGSAGTSAITTPAAKRQKTSVLGTLSAVGGMVRNWFASPTPQAVAGVVEEALLVGAVAAAGEAAAAIAGAAAAAGAAAINRGVNAGKKGRRGKNSKQ